MEKSYELVHGSFWSWLGIPPVQVYNLSSWHAHYARNIILAELSIGHHVIPVLAFALQFCISYHVCQLVVRSLSFSSVLVDGAT